MRTSIFAALGLVLALAGCHTESESDKIVRTDDSALCTYQPAGLNGLAMPSRASALAFPERAEHWAALGWEWQALAVSHADPGYFVYVRACVRQALRLAPRLTSARALSAVALLEQHQFESARRISAELLAENPSNALAAGVLSDARLELGDYAGALQAAQAQLRLSPGIPARSRLAHLAWLTGDVDGALAQMRDALREGAADTPKRVAWALSESASIYRLAGDTERAQRLYSAAVERHAQLPSALLGLSRIALAEGRAADARRWLDQIRLQPQSAESLRLRALSFVLDDDLESAAVWQRRALVKSQGEDTLLRARLLASSPQHAEQALQLIASEMESRGGVHLQGLRAWARFQAGQPCAAALAEIRTAKRFNTPDPELTWYQGEIESACGDARLGEELRADALQSDPLVAVRNQPLSHLPLETRS